MLRGLIAAAVVGLLFAPTAAADPDSSGFLSVLRRAGVKGSDATLLMVGNNVCSQFHAGAGFDSIAKSIWTSTNYQAFQAGMIIEAAKSNLCPDVYDLPSAS